MAMVPRSRYTSGREIVTVADRANEAWAEAKARASGVLRGAPTGFKGWDAAVSGLRGLIVLGGEPSIGKTSFALQAGWHAAAHGAVVAYVSAEMSGTDLLGHLAERLRAEVKRDGGSDADARKTLVDVGRRVAILDAGSDTVGTARKIVKGLKERARAEHAVIVIDGLQALWLHQGRARDSMKEVLDRTMGDLYAAAYAGDLAVLVISHIPKGAQHRVEQFTFSGSGGIDYGADVTARLVADIEDEDRRGTAPVGRRVEFLKNRFGSLASLPFTFYPAEHRFKELSS